MPSASSAAAQGLDAAYATGEDDLDDNIEEATPHPGSSKQTTHPLDGWSEERVVRAVQENPASLGSMSIGKP